RCRTCGLRWHVGSAQSRPASAPTVFTVSPPKSPWFSILSPASGGEHLHRTLATRRRFRFFFFQAEDGIRDWSVTGVQTCALPIPEPVGPPEPVVPPAPVEPPEPVTSRPEPQPAAKVSKPRATSLRIGPPVEVHQDRKSVV